MKKRILLLTKIFPPKIGGIPTYYWNLVCNINKLDIVIVTSDMSGSEEYDHKLKARDVKVFRLNCFPRVYGLELSVNWFFCLVRIVPKVAKIVFNEKIDYIIVGQSDFFLTFVAFISRLITGKPFILFLHGEEIPTIYMRSNVILKYLYNKSCFYYCNSNFTAQKLRCFLRVEINATIINPGVEERFLEEPGIDGINKLKKRLGVEDNVILYTIARLDERKGQDMVIEALPIILKKHPTVKYLIGGIGPKLNDLKHAVERKGLANYVVFLGLVDNKHLVDYHAIGDIFIMPNRILKNGDKEGFGIVFLEANALSKPVIGGNRGGSVDAIIDYGTGLLVDAEDENEIAEKVCFLIENREYAKRLGSQGKERVIRDFRWANLANKFQETLIELSR